MSEMDQAESEVMQTTQWMLKECEELFYKALDQLDNLELAFEKCLEWIDNKVSSYSRELEELEKFNAKYQTQYAVEIGRHPRNEDKCELLLELIKLNSDRIDKLKNDIHAGHIVKESMSRTSKPWETKDTTIEFSQTTTQQTTMHRHRGR